MHENKQSRTSLNKMNFTLFVILNKRSHLKFSMFRKYVYEIASVLWNRGSKSCLTVQSHSLNKNNELEKQTATKNVNAIEQQLSFFKFHPGDCF